jgi:hypothetical protein
VATTCSSILSSYSSATPFSTVAPSSCTAPSGLSVLNLTSTGATLSWAPETGAISYGVAWKDSSSTKWTSTNGITTTSFNLQGLTDCTTYQFMIEAKCNTGGSTYSGAVSFTTKGCTNYCASTATQPGFEYIKNVKLGAVQVTTPQGSAGYLNNGGPAIRLVSGSANGITITPGFGATRLPENEYFTVYIDYDHDGTFTGADETVVKMDSRTIVGKIFSIPASALKGLTRMRIQMQRGVYETNPCANFTYGQVQDFTVNIVGSLHDDSPSPDQGANDNEIRLYPNPARDELSFQFTGQVEAVVKISVYNMAGQKLITQEMASSTGQNIQSINTGLLPQGVYIFEIDNNGNLQRRKFIISR